MSNETQTTPAFSQREKSAASVDAETYRAMADAGMREVDLQNLVVNAALQLGYLVFHALTARTLSGWRTSMIGHIGFPDLVLARDTSSWNPEQRARLLFVELKSSRGRVGEHQQLWLDVLSTTGVETYVWKPADWSSGEIERVLRGEERA